MSREGFYFLYESIIQKINRETGLDDPVTLVRVQGTLHEHVFRSRVPGRATAKHSRRRYRTRRGEPAGGAQLGPDRVLPVVEQKKTVGRA